MAFVPSYAVVDAMVTAARVLKYEPRLVEFVVDDEVKAALIAKGAGERMVPVEGSSTGGQMIRMLVSGWWPVKSQQWIAVELPVAAAGDAVLSARFHQAVGWHGTVRWGSMLHTFPAPQHQ